MTVIWITIAVALVAVWVITIFDIVRRHLGRTRTAAWLLIVLILPFLGAILYWAMRRPEPGEAEYFAGAEEQRRHEAQQRPFDSTRPG